MTPGGSGSQNSHQQQAAPGQPPLPSGAGHSPAHTAAHRHTPRLTGTHRGSPAHTAAHRHAPRLTGAHRCSPARTAAHRRTPLPSARPQQHPDLRHTQLGRRLPSLSSRRLRLCCCPCGWAVSSEPCQWGMGPPARRNPGHKTIPNLFTLSTALCLQGDFPAHSLDLLCPRQHARSPPRLLSCENPDGCRQVSDELWAAPINIRASSPYCPTSPA